MIAAAVIPQPVLNKSEVLKGGETLILEEKEKIPKKRSTIHSLDKIPLRSTRKITQRSLRKKKRREGKAIGL